MHLVSESDEKSKNLLISSRNIESQAEDSRRSSLESVAKNRWVGAYWQDNGLTVIPTISWSTPRSFDFCFDGVEQNAIVAVSTLGCKRSKLQFMRGYDVMLDKVNPEAIVCFGDPLPEMEGNIVKVDYRASRKVVR